MTSKQLRPLAVLQVPEGSPELVKVFDRIRFGPLDEREEYAEFVWFAREYPRVYRHHFDHAEYRLESIYRRYQQFHAAAAVQLNLARDAADASAELSSYPEYTQSTRPNTYAVYWDFESYLSAISSSLDVLARIVGTAYRKQTPSSFNKFCKSAAPDELRALFERAQQRWVRRMKEYRDCFVHYTPVDTLLMMELRELPKHFIVRARLPVNPQVREILGFRYSVHGDVLKYALTVWRHFRAFDRTLARLIWRRYQSGTFPVRTSHLFFVGQRTRPSEDSPSSEA